MKVYKIECEWDMGFKELYKTRAEAVEAIAGIDWIGEVEDCLENLVEDGYIEIIEIDV